MGEKKRAHYGKAGSRTCQWCVTCAEARGGVYLTKQKMCQFCPEKRANFGEEGSTKRQWCGICAQAHGGVNLSRQGKLPAKRSRGAGSPPARKRRRRGEKAPLALTF